MSDRSSDRDEPRYLEWGARAELSEHVACTWASRTVGEGRPHTTRVLPDGCIDVIWDGHQLFVAGPDTRAQLVAATAGTVFVGIRFRPGHGPGFLDLPADELTDQRVELHEILGSAVDPLREALESAPTARAAATQLEVAFVERLDDVAGLRPAALAAADALGRRAVRIGDVAETVGFSERQLHRHATRSFGYGLKTLDRIFRLRRFLALTSSGSPTSLGVAAAEAGYFDQAHLARETRSLTGLTPSALAGRRPTNIGESSDSYKP